MPTQFPLRNRVDRQDTCNQNRANECQSDSADSSGDTHRDLMTPKVSLSGASRPDATKCCRGLSLHIPARAFQPRYFRAQDSGSGERLQSQKACGAPGEIRAPDLLVRSTNACN
jgi:hypothetical protein